MVDDQLLKRLQHLSDIGCMKRVLNPNTVPVSILDVRVVCGAKGRGTRVQLHANKDVWVV